ncbi:MAG: Dabb family protein [Defluviitaleaceae bacterium]|nr:Dabb family protein [Defluviitaleaceae bacterium]
MLRHIVMWNFKEGLTAEQNAENAEKVKATLEALAREIPEILELKVYINELASSNKDIVLNSLFKNEATLQTYQDHPAHVAAAAFVGSVVQDRACIDYYE